MQQGIVWQWFIATSQPRKRRKGLSTLVIAGMRDAFGWSEMQKLSTERVLP
jgi:hypothetical protein